MKGLLLYPFYNQQRLVNSYAAKLREKGIELDYICIANGKYNILGENNWPWVVKALFKTLFFISSEKIQHLYVLLILRLFLKFIISQYNFVDFHAYYPSLYNHLMKKCSQKNIPFYIHLWGTDIMRASSGRINQMRIGFDSCRAIKLTDSMIEIFHNNFGAKYNDKLNVAYFGNNDFDIIDNLEDKKCKQIKQNLYPNSDGKIIVVLGYNAHPAQHHDELIKAVKMLPNELKDRLYLSVPLTYGARPGYIESIRIQLDATNISYRIFDEFIENEELATLRKTADIVLNIQDTDALAGSLQDHLYSGGICIIGEWLNYIVYDKNRVFYIKTNRNNITSHLEDVISNFDAYKTNCKNNHDILKSILSWDSTINNFMRIYGK